MSSVKCLRLLPLSLVVPIRFNIVQQTEYLRSGWESKYLGILIINNLYTSRYFIFFSNLAQFRLYFIGDSRKRCTPVAYKTLTFLWKLEQNWQLVGLILPLIVKTGNGE